MPSTGNPALDALLVYGPLGIVVVRRLLGAAPLEYGAFITTVGAICILAVPIFFGVMFIVIPRLRK